MIKKYIVFLSIFILLHLLLTLLNLQNIEIVKIKYAYLGVSFITQMLSLIFCISTLMFFLIFLDKYIVLDKEIIIRIGKQKYLLKLFFEFLKYLFIYFCISIIADVVIFHFIDIEFIIVYLFLLIISFILNLKLNMKFQIKNYMFPFMMIFILTKLIYFFY